jgi:hypothetical protein
LEDVKLGRLQGPFSSYREFITSLHREVRKLRTKKQTAPFDEAPSRILLGALTLPEPRPMLVAAMLKVRTGPLMLFY